MLAWLAQYRRCRRAGVRVTHEPLVGMWLRRVSVAQVLEAVAIAAEAGVSFPVDEAEVAFLAGGHPIDQARAAAIIAGRGEPVDLGVIAAYDLANLDVVRLARDGWEMSKCVSPGERYRRRPA